MSKSSYLIKNMGILTISNFSSNKIAFYAGEPSKKHEKKAAELMELMENIDEVLSAKSRLVEMTKD